MDSKKKKIFFVGKTFSDKFLDKVQKQFKVVKSLSKQVSILVYVPNTKGAKTQLEKSKDLNIEKLTLTDFYNKYMSGDEELNTNDEEFLSNNKKIKEPTKPPSISESAFKAISDNNEDTTSDNSGQAFIGEPAFKTISDNDEDDDTTTSDDSSPKLASEPVFKSESTLSNALFNDEERKKMVEQFFTPKDKIEGFFDQLIMNDNFYNIMINKNYK